MFGYRMHNTIGAIAVAACLLSLSACGQLNTTDQAVATYRDSLVKWQADYPVPGLAVLIRKGGETIYAEGFGYADIAAQRPVTPNTPFRIASLTKTMTSLLVLQLLEADSLELDNPLGNYWHGYRDFCRRAQGYTHRLYRNYCCQSCHNTVRYHLSHTAQGNPPGQSFEYNGVLYGLFLQVLEEQTGLPYARLLHERIFWQAGMARTLPYFNDTTYPGLIKELAQPYQTSVQGRFTKFAQPQPFEPSASAGVVSTVLDLAKYDSLLDAQTIVAPEWQQQAWTPHRNAKGDTLCYGLGWFVQPNSSSIQTAYKVVWHYGWQPDTYSALYVKVPEQALTLILLANGENLAAPFYLWKGDVTRSPYARSFLSLFATP